jgi:hypothetical protein
VAANWVDGGECMVVPSLSDEQAKAKFTKGFKTVEVCGPAPSPPPRLRRRPPHVALTQPGPRRQVPSGKGYLRYTPQPNK